MRVEYPASGFSQNTSIVPGLVKHALIFGMQPHQSQVLAWISKHKFLPNN